MDRGTISLRYAKALFAYALKQGKESHVYTDAYTLSQNFTKHPALKRVLTNKLLSEEEKTEVIKMCSGANICHEFKNFVHLVVTQRREEFLQTICLSYQDLLRKHNNLMDAVVTTATPMNHETLRRMEQKLGQMTGKKVTVHPIVDSHIMGGYTLRWDTYRLDASVSSSLKRIKKHLTALKNHDRSY